MAADEAAALPLVDSQRALLRERIERLALHAGVALSGAANEQVVGKLDVDFEDAASACSRTSFQSSPSASSARVGRRLEPGVSLFFCGNLYRNCDQYRLIQRHI